MNWSLPTTKITLRKGEVHAWRADLRQMKCKSSFLESTLTEEERSHALSIRFTQDRLWYLLRRGLLRRILGIYTGILPEDIRFTYGSLGKPMLTPISENRLVSFNTSHSHGMAVFAVTKGIPVGVDVEFVRRDVDVEGLARRFFSPEEYKLLLSIPIQERQDAFFATWTLKEAYIKGLGRGLTYPLDCFAVSNIPGISPTLEYDDKTPSETGEWDFLHLIPGEDYRAALAVRCRGSALSLWDAEGVV